MNNHAPAKYLFAVMYSEFFYITIRYIKYCFAFSAYVQCLCDLWKMSGAALQYPVGINEIVMS